MHKQEIPETLSPLLQTLLLYAPQSEEEAADRKQLLSFLRCFPQNCLARDNAFGHFTGTGFVVSRDLTRCLMVYHNIYDSWAWTGGHADGDPDLLAVALREAAEETGVKAVPLLKTPVSVEALTVQGHYKRGNYVSAHLHLNVTYLLTADEAVPLKVKPDENSGVCWFTREEMAKNCREQDFVKIYQKLFRRADELRAQGVL